ncbi:hypothetical protein HHI36_020290 [Cryptolaemus montrouzieri]|uniref:Uncharacterized protein n=1 Tax=Cryptolaemus montrouzieri TaxID=559131 RepID=A0ABD2NBH8_9CUCU
MQCFKLAFPKVRQLENKKMDKSLHTSDESLGLKKTVVAAQTIYRVRKDKNSKMQLTILKKHLRNSHKDTRKQEKIAYIENSFDKTKAVWKVIKRETVTKKKNQNNESSFTADELNSFFADIGKSIAPFVKPSHKEEPRYLRGKTLKSPFPLFNCPTTEEEIENIVHKFKSKMSSDIYGFTVPLLKTFLPIIIPHSIM